MQYEDLKEYPNPYIRALLNSIGTASAATQNKTTGRLLRAGASEGAINAADSNIAYQYGKSATSGINDINKYVADANKRALQYIEELNQRAADRKTNLWSGVGMGLGQLAGAGLGGPLGQWIASKLMGGKYNG